MRKIFSKFVLAFAATTMLLGGLGQAKASFINAPVPTDAYITHNGLEWAWASPVPPDAQFWPGAQLDLSYEAQFGWHLPTAAELTLAPLATDFLIAGGNVPFNGTDPVSGAFFSATNGAYAAAGSAGAVATPYFNNVFHHADWQDGLGQPNGPWAGMPGAFDFADTLVVRDIQGAVPEPSTFALLGLGGLGLAIGAIRRRRDSV